MKHYLQNRNENYDLFDVFDDFFKPMFYDESRDLRTDIKETDTILDLCTGSGALAVYESILCDTVPDSFAERVASVIVGSTETTFYTIAVYFGATNIKKTRHSLPSSLSADFAGFVFSALTVRLIFGFCSMQP